MIFEITIGRSTRILEAPTAIDALKILLDRGISDLDMYAKQEEFITIRKREGAMLL